MAVIDDSALTTPQSITTGSTNDTVTGGSAGDTISTDTGNDTVNGGPGDDTIVAGPATQPAGPNVQDNDTITGGLGNDTMTGGYGNDNFVFNFSVTQSTTTVTTFGHTDLFTGAYPASFTNADGVTFSAPDPHASIVAWQNYANAYDSYAVSQAQALAAANGLDITGLDSELFHNSNPGKNGANNGTVSFYDGFDWSKTTTETVTTLAGAGHDTITDFGSGHDHLTFNGLSANSSDANYWVNFLHASDDGHGGTLITFGDTTNPNVASIDVLGTDSGSLQDLSSAIANGKILLA